MAHHPPPHTDPAALDDPTPTPTTETGNEPAPAAGTATPTGSAPGATPSGTTSDTSPSSLTGTGTDDPIIPPSADITPVSPQPPGNNPANNNTSNHPNNGQPANNPNNGQTNTPDNGQPADNSHPTLGNQNSNPPIADPKQNNTEPQNNQAPDGGSNNHTEQHKPTPTVPLGGNTAQSNTSTPITPKPITDPTPPSITTPLNNSAIPTPTLDPQPHSDPAIPIQNAPQRPASTPFHPQQNSQNANNNSNNGNTGTNLGTIMGILVAAVIGAIVLAGILAMIKRRKKAKDQSDFHPDFFNEKPMGFHNDPDRQSLDSGRGGLSASPDNNRPLKSRADAPYGPRPPSILERHQASPAVSHPMPSYQASPMPSYQPGLMPSYQPGQILNYSNHPPAQHFNLHRPKPPTYHSPYGDQASDLAYANHPPMDPAPNTGVGHPDQNFLGHGMDHDQAQRGFSEHHGGMNMSIPNPIPYPPTTQGEQYPYYPANHQPVMSNLNNAPSYNQQQVDQLDFFGHPSPAATMIGSVPADWVSSSSYEKPFKSDQNLVGAEANVATGIALTDGQTDTKPSPTQVSNLQQSYLDCNDRVSQDAEYPKRNPDDSAESGVPKDAPILNLQQSYLDCEDRGSRDIGLGQQDGFRGAVEGVEGIEMDNLGTRKVNVGVTSASTLGAGGLEWKLATPQPASPMGDFFDEGMMGHDHSPIDRAIDQDDGPAHALYNERPTQTLKVINH